MKHQRIKLFIICLSLLRLCSLFPISEKGSWYLGDTAHYLHFSSRVCHGDWGGEPGKAPLYLWFLCALSPNLNYPRLEDNPPPKAAVSAQVILPLVTQIFLTSAVGWNLASFSPLGAVLWIFDPVILAYSLIIMPEALFASILMIFLILLAPIFRSLSLSPQRAVAIGLMAALCALARTNGLSISLCALAFLLWALRGSKVALKRASFACVIFALLLTPRLYWNQTHYGVAGLTHQGDGWIKSVAGVIENDGKGLDFPNSERLWWQTHAQNPSASEALTSILAHPMSTISLCLKGALRVLVGHVNIEWGSLLSGNTPIGPGFSKPRELRGGFNISPDQKLFWGLWWLGVFSCLIWTTTAYTFVTRTVARTRLDLFTGFCTFMILMQALMPLAYGEARFRASVWPFLIAILVYYRFDKSYYNAKTNKVMI